MTSGIPFSKEELEYIAAHSSHEFPSVIARGLAHQFREYNRGFRSKDSVAAIMKQLRDGMIVEEIMSIAPMQKTPAIPDMRKGKQAKKKLNPGPSHI